MTEKPPFVKRFSLGGGAWNKRLLGKKSNASTPERTRSSVNEKDDIIERLSADSPTEKDTESVVAESSDGGDDNINVVVRVRPLNKYELEKREGSTVQFPGEGVLWVDNNGSIKPFTFNVLFEPEASQRDVFEHSGVKKLVSMAVEGYACTCFAFGQTGSGKTHSITGPPQKFQSGKKLEETDYGLIPRSFHYLLELISEKIKKGSSYTIQASYFELYNEQVVDLLNMQGGKKLNMRWSADQGFYIENLFTIECETFDDLMAVLEEGLGNRSTSSHDMNDNSSRSHSMLTLSIESEQQDPNDENLFNIKKGKLIFVDLAGSEKVKDTNSTGDQLLETNNINKSLLVLGKCISALGDAKKRNGHIPYRDSKLTKLLADSIGGTGVTLMLACVSPSSSNVGETMNTLRYATRAKKIKNKPVIRMDPRERLIITLKKEINVLKKENQLLRDQMHFPSQTRQGGMVTTPTGKEGSQMDSKQNHATELDGQSDLYEMLQQYMIENEALRGENSEYLQIRERLQREHRYISRENDRLLLKVEELQRYILTGDQTIQLPVYNSQYSSRQNSWHDRLSGLSSASSGDTLRSYHSVPDVYNASNGLYQMGYSPDGMLVQLKQSGFSNLPPVKHRSPGHPNNAVYNGYHPIRNGSPALPTNSYAKVLKSPTNAMSPANSYSQKFEVSKSLNFRHPLHPSNPNSSVKALVGKQSSPLSLPMKALPPTTQLTNGNRKVIDSNSTVYATPPVHPKLQYDMNEQLKQELMALDSEIRSTQQTLATLR